MKLIQFFSFQYYNSISDQSITAVAFNSTGDWIALGCSGLGQLLVWEWQSETYVMKQQGHFNNMQCLAYSPDGHHLATGGDDGKVCWIYLSYGSCLIVCFDSLCPSQQFFNHIGMGLSGFNQY